MQILVRPECTLRTRNIRTAHHLSILSASLAVAALALSVSVRAQTTAQPATSTLCTYRPVLSLAASRSGNCASRIAACAAAILYGVRKNVTCSIASS